MFKIINKSLDGFELEPVDGCRVVVLNCFTEPSILANLLKSPAYSAINGAGEAVVVIEQGFYDSLSVEERAAIILHEVGHHKAGHFANQAKYRKFNGVSYFPEHEADAYAIERVGKAAMRSVLMKCIKKMSKSTFQYVLFTAIALVTEPRRTVKLFTPF